MKALLVLLTLVTIAGYAQADIGSNWQSVKQKGTIDAYQDFVEGLKHKQLSYLEYAIYDSASYNLVCLLWEKTKQTNTKEAYEGFTDMYMGYRYNYASQSSEKRMQFQTAFVNYYIAMGSAAGDSVSVINWRKDKNNLTLAQLQQYPHKYDNLIYKEYQALLEKLEREFLRHCKVLISAALSRDSIHIKTNYDMRMRMPYGVSSSIPDAQAVKGEPYSKDDLYILKEFLFPKPDNDLLILTIRISAPEEYSLDISRQIILEYAGQEYSHLCENLDGNWVKDTRGMLLPANTETEIKLLYPLEHKLTGDLVVKILGAKLMLKTILKDKPTDITKYIIKESTGKGNNDD